MCTAISYRATDHYFGRTLDLEYSYRESVTVTPRNFPFQFRRAGVLKRHHAVIGIAHVEDGYPLYYDGVNEMGLAMAGLNFPGYAVYRTEMKGRDNIAPFELIPWVLGQCATVGQAKTLLERVNMADISFSDALPVTPMHWLLADRERAVVVEPMEDGVRVVDDPVGVLTNDPPFEWHLTHLNNFLNLTGEVPENRFAHGLELKPYSRGMGAMGLPGDLSSSSRFVRAAFTKWNSPSDGSEGESVSQFFHILGSVEQTRGCVRLGEGESVRTVYTSCHNAERGICYYTTYENRQITGVDMHREDLEGRELVSYPLMREEQVRWER